MDSSSHVVKRILKAEGIVFLFAANRGQRLSARMRRHQSSV